MALARSGAKDAANAYAIYAIRRIGKIDHVEQVENVSSELNKGSLPQGDAFGDGEITLEQARPPKGIAACASK